MKHIIKKILGGSEELYDVFKITKQKKNFLENYGNDVNDFSNKLDIQMKKNFSDATKVFDYLMYIKDFLSTINHITNKKKYITSFMRRIDVDKNLYDSTPESIFDSFITILSSYMDHYAIYRMLRKFDNKQQKNIVFYGGSFHAGNIHKILTHTGYFKTIVKKQENAYKQHECQLLYKTNIST